MRNLFFIFSLIAFTTAYAQPDHPDDTIPVKIITLEKPDTAQQVKFEAEARPLRAVAGAPSPFYTYFWEFGDGKFSFEKQPAHHYADTGSYQVRVYATNNYDDGKPPPIKPKSIRVDNKLSMAASAPSGIFQPGENLSLKVNRMPRPEEEMVLILAYRNNPGWNVGELKGRIALFYNEKEFRADNFALKEVRKYHAEKPLDALGSLDYAVSEITVGDNKHRGGHVEVRHIPVESAAPQIMEKQQMYRSSNFWEFDDLRPGEERFMFLSLMTTPEMLRDTNAVITVSAVFIPDDASVQTEITELELQIVASHDPNRLMLRNRVMNYRFTGKNRKMNYKVRFQNTGEGPAKQIRITVKVPPALDASKLVITGMSPECIPCADAYRGQSCLDTLIFKDSVLFTFKNVHLPGVQQDGVHDVDSTKGFVSYQLGFHKKPKKVPFASSAAIVFDKNEPIKTNRSVGRFKPGLSPGVIAMYGLQMQNAPTVKLGDRNFNIGFSISPYAPHRKYLQAELYLGGYNTFTSEVIRRDGGEVVIDGQRFKARYQDFYTTTRIVNINLVPVQFRYNLNKFIGVGAGPMLSVDVSTTNQNFTESNVVLAQGEPTTVVEQTTEKTGFSRFDAQVFADLQIGLVRAGPAAGIRVFQSVQANDRRLAFYLTWRL